jgi:hypothetical protein
MELALLANDRRSSPSEEPMDGTGVRRDPDAAARAARHAATAFLVWMALIGLLAWTALLTMLH